MMIATYVDMAEKQTIIIFDLDLTITRFATYMPFLMRAALSIAPWRLAAIMLMPFPLFAFVTGLMGRRELKITMHRLFLGRVVAKEDIEKAAGKFADYVMANGVYPRAREIIADARNAGHRVILATASHRFYVTAIANRLDIGEIIATKSVWHGQYLTNDIDGENCYGAGKLRMIQAHFRQAGVNPDDYHIIFYSDHVSDLPVFEMADQPIATNPSAKMRAVAQSRGWMVENW